MRSGQAGLTTSQVKSGNGDGLPTIAALYVETNGAYFGREGVDPWDEARDARLYDGPFPAVAHPPCARWSRLAGFTEARFGLKRGDDGGCFAAALEAVRKWGGVLEHPAYTTAFAAHGLARPTWHGGWTASLLDGGYTCYVEQGRYGLPVKKATWLYAYDVELPELRWGYTPDADGEQPNGEHGGIDAWRDRFHGRAESSWRSSKDRPRGPNGERRRASHLGLTSTTPPDFRDVLVEMARSATRPFTLSPDGSASDSRARARSATLETAGRIPPEPALIPTAL